MIPVISLAHFDFDPSNGSLTISSDSFGGMFPTEIIVHSHHTGNQIKFIIDHAAAARNEFWDGEMCEYIPIQPTNNCSRLTVYHSH